MSAAQMCCALPITTLFVGTKTLPALFAMYNPHHALSQPRA